MDTVIAKNRATRKRTHSTTKTEPTELDEVLAQAGLVDHPRLAAAATVVRLEPGLYALEIEGTPTLPGRISDAALPVIQISVPPRGQGGAVEIIGASGDAASWIRHDGGTVVVKSPPSGGSVWVTAFGDPEDAPDPPRVEPHPIDRWRSNGSAPEPLDVITEPEEIRTEIVLHVERLGDRRFAGRGWVGSRGRKLRIEAFSIRPIEGLAASDIEIKGLGRMAGRPHGSAARSCAALGVNACR
jgi:hypothetical protein